VSKVSIMEAVLGSGKFEKTIVEGLQNPEDICRIPGTDWVVTSAMSGPLFEEAKSSFVNMRTHEVRSAYPDNCVFDLDRERFGEIEPPEAVYFHGLDVVKSADGVITLYQVNHPLNHGPRKGAGRESVEVFEIRLGAEGPTLVWRGAVVAPSFVRGNEVVGLPQGGFAITNFALGGLIALAASGGTSGHVLEWPDRTSGWRIVEGTDVNAPNGLAVSPDGAYYFIASSGTQQFHRISRRDPHGDRVSIDTKILNDNVTWTHDGALLLGGPDLQLDYHIACTMKGTHPEAPFRCIRVDPDTMRMQTLIEDQVEGVLPTVALQLSDTEIWVSYFPGSRILIYQQ
jgi:hypothetical protein